MRIYSRAPPGAMEGAGASEGLTLDSEGLELKLLQLHSKCTPTSGSLSTYYMPGAVSGTRNTAMNKRASL